MKKILSMLAVVAMTASFVACDDDETTPDGPMVTAPAVTSVQVGASVDIAFTAIVPGGFKSAEVTAEGGTATVKTPLAAGATEGQVVVTFTANQSEGTSTVTLKVTDNNNKVDSETAALTKLAVVKEFVVSANIGEDVTWETGKTYILAGRITVLSGATLTIEPGVLVKGQAGTQANATALLVARGGKLMAEGTADLPIVFTTTSDELTPEDIAAGNIASPNLDPTTNGYWGGLIILGNAPISASAAEVQIEGIPTSDPNGLYGGNDPEDNSGVIRYVSIRHGGTNIGAGNEINGLTLGGVGAGTVIEHIEVVANQDDGVEWFGGTVNVKNLVVWNVGDDAVDTDQSWAGTLDNFVVVSPAGSCFELDGPEGAMKAGHVIRNGTVIASSDEITAGALLDVDPTSIVELQDIYFTAIKTGQLFGYIDQSPFTGTCNDNGCPFSGIELQLPTGTVLTDFIQDGVTPAGVSGVTSPTVGADLDVFGWTWTAKAGIFAGL